MKKYIITIAAAALVLIINGKAFTQSNSSDSINKKMNTREELFAQQVFKAFQNNDEAFFESLYPTNEEYKALLQSFLAAKVKDISQQKIDAAMVNREQKALAATKKLFTELQAQADSVGINWSNTTYLNYDWQEMYPEEVHQKYLYGTIWFSINGVRYMIEDVQAVEIPAGYKLQKIYRIRKAEDIN